MAADSDPIPTGGSNRLDVLDGLRGVAALMVVAFHFMARWTDTLHVQSLYSYGDIFLDWFPPLRYFGIMGVQLFFVISGFVIMLTLTRCTGLLDFAGRRAARLWPTMFVCATLTTLLVNGTGIHARFEGVGYWEVLSIEYISSILFFDPGLTGRLLDYDGRLWWADGVYWTLWVEVRFYLLIALVFWISPRKYFLWSWAAIQGFSTSLTFLNSWDIVSHIPLPIEVLFQPNRLLWFTIGICGYFFWKKELTRPVLIAGAFALIDLLTGRIIDPSSGFTEGALTWTVIYAVILAPFILFILRSPVMSIFATRWLVTIGLASYPLYMFHERVGIIATTYLSDWGVPPLLALVVTVAALIAFAIFLSRILENPAKSLILKYWKPFASNMQSRFTFLQYTQK